MKKMVAQETTMVEESATTDQGTKPPVQTSDVDSFIVVLDKEDNNIKLFHDGLKIMQFEHDDRTYLEKSFTTLLNTVKQKIRFWTTN